MMCSAARILETKHLISDWELAFGGTGIHLQCYVNKQEMILVINQFNEQIKLLFYNKFLIFLYVFRALCAHHQEVKIVLSL